MGIQNVHKKLVPGTIVSMLPPASAAKSTTTDPGFISSIMYFLIKIGAFLPEIQSGIRKKVHTDSTDILY